jgi:hypothetical protein
MESSSLPSIYGCQYEECLCGNYPDNSLLLSIVPVDSGQDKAMQFQWLAGVSLVTAKKET